jgi:hypothetical protein
MLGVLGVGAVVSPAEIAHGRLRRIIRHNSPAHGCFLSKRFVHLSASSNPVTLLYQFAVQLRQCQHHAPCTYIPLHSNNKQTNVTLVASTTTTSLSKKLLKTPYARDIPSSHTQNKQSHFPRITSF